MIQTLTKAEQDPDNFLMDLQVRGKTPETVNLLKAFAAGPLDDDVVNRFFANQTLTPFQQSLLKSLPNTVRLPSGAGKGTIEWATKYYTENPDKLRRDLITAGRNENTEALVKQLYPQITDRGLEDYFGVSATQPVSEWQNYKPATFKTPAGKTATYKMTDAEWNSMIPGEKDAYKQMPDAWLQNRDAWSKQRVIYDRFKIIAEDILGIKIDPQKPLDYVMNVVNAELWVVPIPLGKLLKPLAKLTKGLHILPEEARAFVKPLEDFLTKARSIKPGQTKVSEEVLGKVKEVLEKPLPEGKAPEIPKA